MYNKLQKFVASGCRTFFFIAVQGVMYKEDMKNNTTPAIRPNRIIWEHANSFKDAAEICWEKRLIGPLAVNAALAIELYLKSMLALNIRKEESRSLDFTSEKGHQFERLISKIEPGDKALLFEALNKIDSNLDWLEEFRKFENTFIDVRYWYESQVNVLIKPEIVDLAKNLGEAVLAVGKIKHA